MPKYERDFTLTMDPSEKKQLSYNKILTNSHSVGSSPNYSIADYKVLFRNTHQPEMPINARLGQSLLSPDKIDF